MPRITVNVELDDFDDSELIDELEYRGYNCTKKSSDLGFLREDWQFLLDLLDKNPETWYTRRVREKVSRARFE